MKDNLFTLDQLHEKQVTFYKTPDKALAYIKQLKNISKKECILPHKREQPLWFVLKI